MSDAYLYCVPEGGVPSSHCPDCTGSTTMWLGDRFTCKDCCNEWTTEYNFHDHEPETNPDR